MHALHTSPQAEQSFHEHFTDHGGVSVSQNGLHSGSAPHSEQPLQPPQVHLSSQAGVLCSQCALHTGAGEGDGGGSPVSDGGSSEHSEQAPQPFQLHRTPQGCVLLSQNCLHCDGGVPGARRFVLTVARRSRFEALPPSAQTAATAVAPCASAAGRTP